MDFVKHAMPLNLSAHCNGAQSEIRSKHGNLHVNHRQTELAKTGVGVNTAKRYIRC